MLFRLVASSFITGGEDHYYFMSHLLNFNSFHQAIEEYVVTIELRKD